MRARGLVSAALAVTLFLTACGGGPAEGDLPSGDPDVAYHVVDRGVPAETAKKVLDAVLRAAPHLKSLRAAQQAKAGAHVALNLSLLSGPDPEGANEIEKTHHFVYVNTSGPDGLITTETFVVSADLTKVGVFGASGDDVESVEKWAAERGLR